MIAPRMNLESELSRRTGLKLAAAAVGLVASEIILGSEQVEAKFGSNLELNPSFNDREFDISIGDLWKPKHWTKVIGVDLEDYVQNSQARSGGRCVKVRVFNKFNKCNLFSGAWQSEDPMKIDPNKTFRGGFFAKFKPLGDVHEVMYPRMVIIPLNRQGDVLKPIVFAPKLKSVLNWESYQFDFGHGMPRDFPQGTYAILRRFDAVGTAAVCFLRNPSLGCVV